MNLQENGDELVEIELMKMRESTARAAGSQESQSEDTFIDLKGTETAIKELQENQSVDIPTLQEIQSDTLTELESDATPIESLEIQSELTPTEPEEIQTKTPTESQLEVINYPANFNELLAVTAGPGSGKTLTVATRIGKLIQDGMKPEEILVLSMTNRAVLSLKSQLRGIIPGQVSKLHLSTFHSFCGALLDDYGLVVTPGYSKKRLVDDLSWRNFSDIFLGKSISLRGKKVQGTLSPAQLEKVLFSIKTGELTVEQATRKFKVSPDYLTELIDYLEKNGMMRYLDLITDALHMMEKSNVAGDPNAWIPQVARYKAVLVDEFQDMHYLLLKVIKSVVNYPTYDMEPGKVKHLTISGDPNQCIYEFLGSRPGLMKELDPEFPDMKTTQLTIKETFRLTPEVLKVASDVALKANGLLIENSLYSTKLPTYKPIMYSRDSGSEEHLFILKEIARLILELGGLLKPWDFIILTRTNKEIEQFHAFLENHGMKSNIFSLTNPWIKSKVHLFLDILSVINQGPGSDFLLLCAIRLLDVKVGARLRVSKLFVASENWRLEKESQFQMLESYIMNRGKTVDAIYKTQPLTLQAIFEFLDRIRIEREALALDLNPTKVVESLYRIINNTEIVNYMNSPAPGKVNSYAELVKEHRIQLEENLNQFYATLTASYNKFSSDEHHSFIDHFLATYNEDNPILDTNLINLSTVHTAKGLEFPVVFLPGCSNSYWSAMFDKAPAHNETSRLFYVGATRASHLLYAGNKTQTTYPAFVTSNFTREMPKLLEPVNSNGTLLDNFSINLGRKIDASRIEAGRSINLNLFRSFHTCCRRLIR